MTKDIEIIRFTADSGDKEFMTDTFIFLFDCSRKPRPNVGCQAMDSMSGIS